MFEAYYCDVQDEYFDDEDLDPESCELDYPDDEGYYERDREVVFYEALPPPPSRPIPIPSLHLQPSRPVVKDRQNKTCSVCLEDICKDADYCSRSCGNRFHQQCIYTWLKGGKSTCPICRSHYHGQQIK